MQHRKPNSTRTRLLPGPVRKQVALTASESGATALEFALLAPFLILALLSTVDVGRAVTDQMGLGSLLRTGAQAAMSGRDVSGINAALQAGTDGTATLDVTRVCGCPEDAGTAVACSTTCAGPAPTAVYYRLVAQKTFSGIFLPAIPLSRSLQVQVR